MKRKGNLFVAGALLVCLILQGCTLKLPGQSEAPQTGSRMVTQVSVDCVPEDASQTVIYTDSEKIQAVLSYLGNLKLLKRNGNGSDPYGGPTRTITLQYSGGNSKVYYLVEEEFLREGDADWVYVEEEPEVTLEEILRDYASDGEDSLE